MGKFLQRLRSSRKEKNEKLDITPPPTPPLSPYDDFPKQARSITSHSTLTTNRKREKMISCTKNVLFLSIYLIIFSLVTSSMILNMIQITSTRNNNDGDEIEQVENIIPSKYQEDTKHSSSIKLVHVLSPFHDPSTNSFSPLNTEQWLSLLSSASARDIYNSHVLEQNNKMSMMEPTKFSSVVLVCAVLEADFEVLNETLLHYCDHIKVLPRSTADVYHNQAGMKALPFVQDIMDAARSILQDNEEEYYIMFTNSDICPTSNFYIFLEEKIRINNYQVLIVNRMTIPDDLVQYPVTENNQDRHSSFQTKHEAIKQIIHQSHDIMNSGQAMTHPGTDCFIFHSSFLEQVNFGELFLGFPPWAGHVLLMTEIMVDDFNHFGYIESMPNGTFHIGDPQTWKEEESDAVDCDSPWDYEVEDIVKWSPFPSIRRCKPKNIHNIQNSINCGKLYRPNREDGSVVPAFVQPGYEQVFTDGVKRKMNQSYVINGANDIIGSHLIIQEMTEDGALSITINRWLKINEIYQLKHKASKNLCLEPDTLNNGEPIRLRECVDGTYSQHWYMDEKSQIRSKVNMNKCITSTTAPAVKPNLFLGDCINVESTRWSYDHRTSQLISNSSVELVIGIPVHKAADGKIVNLCPNNSDADGQWWVWIPVIAVD